MPFTQKTWEDRLVEFAGRRKLTDVTTQAVQTVDVTRDEGNVSREGTAFSASNMNDLEQRIAECVAGMEATFQDGVDTLYNQCESCGVTPSEKTPAAIASAIMTIYTNRYNAGVNATKIGTATAAQVLSGYTFTNDSTVGASGSMPNRGQLNFNPSGSTSQSVASGYYSGGTISSQNAYNAGYAAGVAVTPFKGYVLNNTIPANNVSAAYVQYPLTGVRTVSVSGTCVNQYVNGYININGERVWTRNSAYEGQSTGTITRSVDPNGNGTVEVHIEAINGNATGLSFSITAAI